MRDQSKIKLRIAAVFCAFGLATLLWPLAAQINIIDLSSTITGTLPISNGGTGQITNTLAFNALSPVTTRGDLIYRDATNNVRLAKGTSGQFLTIGANDPAWAAVPAFTGQVGAGDSGGFNPADGVTYYIGALFGVDPGTGDGADGGFYIPRAATLVAVYTHFAVVGTLGSNENVSVIVRKNATTDILTVSSTTQLTAAAVDASSAGNAIAVSAGDHIVIKMVSPTWVTNPTIVFVSTTFYFEVP